MLLEFTHFSPVAIPGRQAREWRAALQWPSLTVALLDEGYVWPITRSHLIISSAIALRMSLELSYILLVSTLGETLLNDEQPFSGPLSLPKQP